MPEIVKPEVGRTELVAFAKQYLGTAYRRGSSHIGHVGIICEADGMKSRFIHASSGKAYGVTISRLDSEGYKRRFYKCIDVISLP